MIGMAGINQMCCTTVDECIQPWTSLYMDGTESKFFLMICPHEAGTWDPNYTPGVDFLDHDLL